MKPLLHSSCLVRSIIKQSKLTGTGIIGFGFGSQSWHLNLSLYQFELYKLPCRSASTSQFHKNVQTTSSNSSRTSPETPQMMTLRNSKHDHADKKSGKSFKIFNESLPRSSLVLDKNRKSLERPEQFIPPVSQLMEEDEALQSPDYFQVFNLFTVKDLFDARVHFGHKIGSMHANMRPFIFGSRFDQIIFDLDLTAFHLRQALNFIAHVAYRSGVILFITRSPQTMHLVETTAIECGEYAHTRAWDTAILADSRSKFGGIIRLPDLLICLNVLDNVLAPHSAIKDAAKMLIPTVGIVDSNCNPNLITFPVPGNDDTPSSVELYCKLFKEAILRGKNKRKVNDLKRQSSPPENSTKNDTT